MRFEDKIRLLAVLFRFSVTSWLRSKQHNVSVGGVPDSRHLFGLAVDVVFDRPEDRADFGLMATGLGLQVIDEGDHVHVQEPRSKS
jgi:hypothetical protein